MDLEKLVEKTIEDINLSGFKSKVNLTINEVSQILGIGLSKLEDMRKNANGPNYLKMGRRIIYPKRSIAEFIVNSQIRTL
ncbi:helix-turn-helix domain-containing protein [Aliarcobacter butzleri]|uniref:Helix-turn-helix domain-containing protein n=1 Tax=Aliarcobacter butzleri TaxID=28197 RepID=A0AAW7PU62_9BACT|nr:helix-turn-helix domain-containing protein [Aliarcobacter butzleri]MDN5069413.1 helix-turn-helix domain-containing protein [Aliarcobacter butzleri]